MSAIPSVVQRSGRRPEGGLESVRQRPEWERLRRAIYRQGFRVQDDLVFDLRRLLTDASCARDAGVLMWELVRDLEPQVLVGPGFGATPLLYGMAMAALSDGVNLQVLMVRDKRKDHNQKKWVEGDRKGAEGKRAVFVDDFILGGSAVPLVEKALAADKVDLEIAGAAVFFDMWEPLGTRQISVSKFPVRSLFARHDIGLSRDSFDAVAPTMKGAYPDFVGAEPRWHRFDLNRHTGYPTKCAPIVADGAVFAADDRSRLWRHDVATGDIDWMQEQPEQPHKGIVQKLQAHEGSLVYGCYDGTVTRLDQTTGEPVWRWRIDSSIHATPWVDGAAGRLYINTEQWNEGSPAGHMQCLDWHTGHVIWKQRHAWWPPGSPAADASCGHVVAACNDQTLSAWRLTSGERVWTARTRGLFRGRPALAGGKAFVATETGWLQCFCAATGERLWESRCGKGLWHQFLHLTERFVIVMDAKWHLFAFERDTGDLAWLTRMRSPGCWGPVTCGKYLVVLSKLGHLAVIDPEAEVKVWEGQIPGTYHQPAAIGDGLLVAASSDQGLFAFDIHPFYA